MFIFKKELKEAVTVAVVNFLTRVKLFETRLKIWNESKLMQAMIQVTSQFLLWIFSVSKSQYSYDDFLSYYTLLIKDLFMQWFYFVCNLMLFYYQYNKITSIYTNRIYIV